MFFSSIIQIGPEVLNKTTNVISFAPSSVDSEILESMVVLLVGALIFLTVGIKFEFIKLSYLSETHENKWEIHIGNLINLISLLFFFGSISIAIIFTLYTELISPAKFTFAMSLAFLGIFIFKNIFDRA